MLEQPPLSLAEVLVYVIVALAIALCACWTGGTDLEKELCETRKKLRAVEAETEDVERKLEEAHETIRELRALYEDQPSGSVYRTRRTEPACWEPCRLKPGFICFPECRCGATQSEQIS